MSSCHVVLHMYVLRCNSKSRGRGSSSVHYWLKLEFDISKCVIQRRKGRGVELQAEARYRWEKESSWLMSYASSALSDLLPAERM